MTLSDLNDADPDQAAALVRPCLDVPRWVDAVVAGRPYATVEEAVRRARQVLEDDPLTPSEVDAALAHHPRIGERARGTAREAALSRGEQRGLDLTDAVQRELRAANEAYEARFDRVFLIRAAGRDATKILAECRRRTANDPHTEEREVADQLGQIALLRLEGALT
ncbi:2-oxo-4-hydroxy-4-carboxy-5-ureidoimidazoline decarboxylase [Ornithinimicrobium flavum]|uniref:2-oxo-4-hydroxy-4-carboxy-5-ureidoimidazoline decarboxylase n=1 Tax=Ornithinimicrobium flavum TaxID=1288636 RepID=UPI0010701515|nr:2-oxo-4-hydroxy-4-carboxy-5-ureidoimidazoline decarboxylase [Ornithinimicrobium flavum]